MTRQRSRPLAEMLAARPVVDLLVPVAAGLFWAAWGASLTPADTAARSELYGAVATLAALVLAAATFVCAMVYQSASAYVEQVRQLFASTLSRNWTAIIASSLVAAVLPIVAMVVDTRSTRAAMVLAVMSLALIIVRFARTLYWLRLTLFLHRATDEQPRPYAVPGPSSRAS